jgi:uncharacterized delta-60 repeat protein
VAALVMSLAGATAAQAAPGDLDASFGQAGVATMDLHHNAFGNALVVQSDGKIVVAGTAISPSGQTSDVVTARFTEQGAPDTSYGVAGTGAAQPDFGHNETGYAAALQPDGKVLVAGDIDQDRGMSRPLVARFSANGTLDATFGQGKGWTSPLDGSDYPDIFGRAIALNPNGNIVIGGYIDYGPDSPMIATGTPDGSFSDAGEVDPDGADGTMAGIAVAKDDSVEGAGVQVNPGAAGDFQISHVTGRSFSSIVQNLGGEDDATAVALQPDGKLVVAGYTNFRGTNDFAVVRYTSNQVLDTSFGTGGTEIVDLGGSDLAKAVVVQSDGKIVLAGTTTSGSVTQIGVVTLLPNGQLDSGFGHNGVSLIGAGTATLEGNAVGLEPGGDIVVGGTLKPAGGTQHNLVVVRLHGDVSGNTGGGTDGGGTGGGSTGGGSAPSSGGPSTAVLPTLSGLTASRTQIHEGRSLPKLNPTGHPSGLVLSVSVSEAAKITLEFLKPAPGRFAHGHCSAPSKSNKGARHCTRYIAVGSVSFQAKAGANTVAFSGRLSPSKKLKPGTYTLAITASAANGTSNASKLAITILP